MGVTTTLRLVVCIFVAVLLMACEKNEPIQLGFVAGMSGRVADLGIAGRNGVQLAVEQCNAEGGVNGRLVNLVVRDDQQNPETAKQVVGELIEQGIELIIGPMTSSMALAMLPQVEASGSILLSPTATTTDLVGKDDSFLRVISSTTDYAEKIARYQYEKLGVRTVAAIYDSGNKSYCESWLRDYRQSLVALGGQILLSKSFRSGADTVFQPLAEELLAVQADAIVIISNTVDSALLCQQLRKLAPGQRIAMAEWASTERFIELAGSAAEGVIVSQFIDRNDKTPHFRKFVTAYRERFKQAPGFSGLASYDAALVALEAYAIRRPGQTLKQVIIDKKSFQGGQQQLAIDRFGDSNRKTFVTVVRSNQYVTVE